MPRTVVLLSIPGLRAGDVGSMPRLQGLARRGDSVPLRPSFPAVTCPVQVNLTTGVGPEQHGVIANGFHWREKGQVEMWTAWNSAVEAPQLWETLKQRDSSITSAVWFPLLSKGAKADFICTPAPIHNPDGSESLWCYTVPTEMYGTLRDSLGHFPLMNFWGPLSSIKSTAWIVDSFVQSAHVQRPRFSYIYLPHLDYAAQKFGPDSTQALTALAELDLAIGALVDGFAAAGIDDVTWLAASEYVITPVSRVGYPNRVLREAGLFSPKEDAGAELLAPAECRAFAMVDHQFAHVYVRDAADVPRAAAALRSDPTVAEVLVGDERGRVGLNHPRSGEIVITAHPDAWFAYYWWLDDARAPGFARTVDIHRKPGYDPVEMFIDMPSKRTPLDATLVKGSHGLTSHDAALTGVLVSSDGALLGGAADGLRDVDVAGRVFQAFGVSDDWNERR
ncbi:MAG: alkaline phosphatase family protein [Planctomyces sp.]|nr:alkaline phosphatase family protein [Planctomyces sp.]